MKKRILLFTLVAGFGYIILSSASAGPGNAGYNCTGADASSGAGNPTGCVGGSCHGSSVNTGITVKIELDSAGVTTSSTTLGTGHYKPGYTYTIKITGTNTTASNLPKFGFQISATKGATATATVVNAGALQSTGLPTGTHYLAAPGTSSSFYANLVEHSTRLSPTSGTGATGTTYVESITWTAPAAGTGVVSLWAAINAVNNLPPGGADAGDLSNTNHLVLNESSVTTSVSEVSSALSITAFPNPTTSNLNINLDNAQAGTYTLSVFGMTGAMVANRAIEVNGTSSTTGINTANWATGLYNVVIEKDGSRKTLLVVKQ